MLRRTAKYVTNTPTWVQSQLFLNKYPSLRLLRLLMANTTSNQPSVHISPAQEEPSMDHDLPISRSTSTTSSLDPYYFGIRSPSDSPLPPMPTCLIHPSSTPDQRPVQDPVTPARDPATIDRRGLVGVGELTTPRWTRTEHRGDMETPDNAEENGEFEVLVPRVTPDDEPDSPWTIEAVDSESSEKEEVGLWLWLAIILY
jgi:dual specificity tyrosine-phosphorylation-regulated kinase 2/3/4